MSANYKPLTSGAPPKNVRGEEYPRHHPEIRACLSECQSAVWRFCQRDLTIQTFRQPSQIPRLWHDILRSMTKMVSPRTAW